MGAWWCAVMPWHRLRVVGKPSANVDHVRCTCGREYGMHHKLETIIEWNRDLAEFHGDVDDYHPARVKP